MDRTEYLELLAQIAEAAAFQLRAEGIFYTAAAKLLGIQVPIPLEAFLVPVAA